MEVGFSHCLIFGFSESLAGIWESISFTAGGPLEIHSAINYGLLVAILGFWESNFRVRNWLLGIWESILSQIWGSESQIFGPWSWFWVSRESPTGTWELIFSLLWGPLEVDSASRFWVCRSKIIASGWRIWAHESQFLDSEIQFWAFGSRFVAGADVDPLWVNFGPLGIDFWPWELI